MKQANEALSGDRLFFYVGVMKHVQNAVSEASKIAIAISISFEDFDFVFVALGKRVRISKIEVVKNRF